MNNFLLLKVNGSFLEMKYFNEDFYGLVFLLGLNLIVNFILIRLIYYPNSERKKEYLFSFFFIGFVVFLLGFVLKSDQIKTGIAFGLFAVFSIIRIRTSLIPVKEMAYFFGIIGVSLVLSLAKKINLSFAELGLILGVVLGLAFVLELFLKEKKKVIKVKEEVSLKQRNVLYGNLDKVKPENKQILLDDIKFKTGLNVIKIEVGTMNLKKGEANLIVYYKED